MEGINNTNYSKLHLKGSQKQVTFSDNNVKFISSLLNSNEPNENNNLTNANSNSNTNINNNANNTIINNINSPNNNTIANILKTKYLSPRKSKSIAPVRKQSLQTPITFRSSFKKKEFDTPKKLDDDQNNINSLNIDMDNPNNVNSLLNSNTRNNMSIKRTNTNSSIKPRLSMFSLKNKRMSNNKILYNIKTRNSDLDNNKFKFLFKSEGDEKTEITNLLTTTKKKDFVNNDENNYTRYNISRKNSVNSNKIKTAILNKKFIYRRTNTISNSKLSGTINIFSKKKKI